MLSEKLDKLQEDILEMQEVMRTQTCHLGSLSKIIALAYAGVGRTLDEIGHTLDHLDRSSSVSDNAYDDIFKTLQKIAMEAEKANRYLEEVAEPYFRALAEQQFAVRSAVYDDFLQLKNAADAVNAAYKEAFAGSLIQLLGWRTQEDQAALEGLIQTPEPDLGEANLPE